MKKILLILALFAGFLAWQSCEYDWIESEPVPETISYATNVQPIFDAGCNAGACHGATGTAPDLTPEGSYDALINGGFVDTADPASSIIYMEIAPGGSMNKYSSLGDSDVILKWIQQGAQNN